MLFGIQEGCAIIVRYLPSAKCSEIFFFSRALFFANHVNVFHYEYRGC